MSTNVKPIPTSDEQQKVADALVVLCLAIDEADPDACALATLTEDTLASLGSQVAAQITAEAVDDAYRRALPF